MKQIFTIMMAFTLPLPSPGTLFTSYLFRSALSTSQHYHHYHRHHHNSNVLTPRRRRCRPTTFKTGPTVRMTSSSDDVFINCNRCGSDIAMEERRVKIRPDNTAHIKCPECNMKFSAPLSDFVRFDDSGNLVPAQLGKPKGAMLEKEERTGREVKIWVGGLGYRVREEQLRRVFEKFGQVLSCTVVCDRDTRKSRGFGFVEMASRRDALTAIELVQTERSLGRIVRAKLAD